MTTPVRVPGDVHAEVQGAARLFGCTPGELLQRAWSQYRESDEFRSDFEHAQKAFAVGDFRAVADRLHERARERAEASAAAANAQLRR